ncbi:lysylphosphatidylglycerol synthase transmembrane domain-containing protein [Halorussus sp. MSC15.2]|uniref:lysylphosphatidylglycerol synthase transmembrane domain-containing protein n=1 Tax=Halorussus sp. MSC15.2 TaxID=2283638 RepID=UPI0013D53B04|nr:lysylphosphatidylglycerol synthase transmembrane domain-containing protein [Halorussus sp. MSC15.2]NEU55591.1 flippase-like domain-containing protein [Halorussus sp. MSC15.2]
MDVDLGDARSVLVGFGAGAVVLVALYSLVGLEDVASALSRADPWLVASVCVVAVGWLFAWAMALRTVLSVIAVEVSVWRAFLLFAGATFANNVTPFGQAGGEPFSALLVSRTTGTEYENGLAAVASVDTLNFVPSITFALVGVGYYGTQFTAGDRVELAALALVALALGVPILASLGWRNRYRVSEFVVSAAVPVGRTLGRVVPGVAPPDETEIRGQIEGFFAALERVGGDHHKLALALSFSALGWLLLSVSLWLSLLALGHAVPFAAALFIVPLGSVASITPLPGGLGGVESALILLIVPITGVDAGTAAAAAVLHRGATYLLPVLLGGSATAMLEADNVHESASD